MSGQPTSPERVEDEDASLVVIGHTVRVERKRRGWSVASLSERAGVSFGLLSGLERGQGNPSYRALHRIAAALEIPTTKLLTADSATDLVVRAGTNDCKVDSGVLADPYTGARIDFEIDAGPSSDGGIQIDHVVALADAWVTGAQSWREDTMVQFGNDPLNLLAVD
ncbi:helix-turn-helix domain-containing protein, partial [Cutibacterium acnes]